jgi:acyl carrier protein
MSAPDIVERLRQVMRRSAVPQLDWDGVNAHTPIEKLGFDSLTILDLIYDIQQEFKLEFDPTEIAGVKTVGQLADFIKQAGA